MLRARGRPMVLQRPNDSPPPADLPVQGFLALFAPDQVKPPVTQGDAQVQILNDEIAAATWPAPGIGTWVVEGGQTWAVLGATPRYEGAACIGWSLWVRGGQP